MQYECRCGQTFVNPRIPCPDGQRSNGEECAVAHFNSPVCPACGNTRFIDENTTYAVGLGVGIGNRAALSRLALTK